ncbi:MAG: hypothetical protein FWC34_00495 [Bacteroidetes bacterium]|nr:hypothetical protein [Bacteroidota bacterium]
MKKTFLGISFLVFCAFLFLLGCNVRRNNELAGVCEKTFKEDTKIIESANKNLDNTLEQFTADYNIDGYFINRRFEIWKIYTYQNITHAIHLAAHARNTNRIFQVKEKAIENGMLILTLFGTPNPGNPNPPSWTRLVLDKRDTGLYLYEFFPTIMQLRFGRWTGDSDELNTYNEFRREDITYQESKFRRMQRISLWRRGAHYYRNTIYVINPRYPIMEIVAIEVDEKFIVQNINVGEIVYEDGEIYAHFSNKKLSMENDLIGRMSRINLFPDLHRWQMQDIIYPSIGERLVSLQQNFIKVIEKRVDFGHSSVGNIIERLTDSILINVNEKNYVIKNGVIVDNFPRSTQDGDFSIIEQNDDITIINYFEESSIGIVNFKIIYGR